MLCDSFPGETSLWKVSPANQLAPIVAQALTQTIRVCHLLCDLCHTKSEELCDSLTGESFPGWSGFHKSQTKVSGPKLHKLSFSEAFHPCTINLPSAISATNLSSLILDLCVTT
jgi:hypothetical protein